MAGKGEHVSNKWKRGAHERPMRNDHGPLPRCPPPGRLEDDRLRELVSLRRECERLAFQGDPTAGLLRLRAAVGRARANERDGLPGWTGTLVRLCEAALGDYCERYGHAIEHQEIPV